MTTILKGAPVVAAMNERNAALCEQLKAKGITPTLAVVRVGEREDDLSYERGVMTRCGKVGVAVKQFVLPADATPEQLLRILDEVNTDDGIHGCLLFRPLPKQFDDRTIRAALRPEKDIDGITDGSLAGVFTNTALGYAPCTAQACMEILKYYNVPLSGKRAVVVDVYKRQLPDRARAMYSAQFAKSSLTAAKQALGKGKSSLKTALTKADKVFLAARKACAQAAPRTLSLIHLSMGTGTPATSALSFLISF